MTIMSQKDGTFCNGMRVKISGVDRFQGKYISYDLFLLENPYKKVTITTFTLYSNSRKLTKNTKTSFFS